MSVSRLGEHDPRHRLRLRARRFGLAVWPRASLLVALFLTSAVTLLAPRQDVNEACAQWSLVCGLMQDLLTVVLLALYGFYLLYGRKRQRVMKHYLELVRDAPQQLVEQAPSELRVNELAGRELVLQEAFDILADDVVSAPLLIVGEAGSGKTILLARLAAQVAAAGRIPVPISLRGQSRADFAELARQQFLGQVDGILNSADEGDRIWRKVRRSGLLVVLADGVDDFASDLSRRERDNLIWAAVEDLRREGARGVLTSRPLAAPPGSEWVRVSVSGLAKDEAVAHLEDVWNGPLPDGVDQLLDDPLNRLPFYLQLLGSLPPQSISLERGGGAAARLHMIGSAVHQRLAESGTSSVHERAAGLGRVGVALLVSNYKQAPIDSLVAADAEFNGEFSATSIGAAVASGLESGILQQADAQKVRFQHDLLLAYCSATALAGRPQHWERILEAGADDDTLNALTWIPLLVDGEDRRQRGRAVFDLLRDRGCACSEPDDQFRLLSAALAVAATCELRLEVEQVCLAFPESGQSQPSRPIKLQLINTARGVTEASAADLLWKICRDDPEWSVRWRAAQSLGDRVVNSGVFLTDVRSLLAAAADDLRHGRPCGHLQELGMVAWLLPLAAVRATEAGAPHGFTAQLTTLQRLATTAANPLRLEPALARGYKLAAMTAPGSSVSSEARRWLTTGLRFWYSRLTLVHAIAIEASLDRGNVADALTVLESLLDVERHPLVREAVRLATEGLRASAPWRRWAWDVETEAVKPTALYDNPALATLVAEVVVAFNLLYRPSLASIRAPEGTAEAVTLVRQAALPSCVGTGRSRRMLLDEGTDDRPSSCSFCQWQLCPYPGKGVENARPRLDFSHTFCIRQAARVRRSGVPPWVDDMRRGELVRFWIDMAEFGATPGGSDL